MLQRGKRGFSARTTMQAEGYRPDPPAILSADEQAIWRMTVKAMPDDWFGPATLPILTEYCRAVVLGNAIAEDMKNTPEDERWKIIRQQQRQASLITQMATKLKIYPKAKIDGRRNIRKPPTQRKPWAKKEEDE